MRKYYLDNIRWATVLAVVFYHVLFMYNHTLTSGVAGAVTDFAGQDALQYLLYPWFMVVLFLVSGACTRYALDKRSAKAFLAERTRKLLVPSTLGLLVLGVGLKLCSVLSGRLKKQHLVKMDPEAQSFLHSFLSIALKAVVIIIAVNIMGVPMASIVTLLGSCGLAIGLALQGSLSNFAGGIMLLLFHPFRVGDYIVSGDTEGTVEAMSVFYTTLTTFDNSTVVIPNATLSNSALKNLSLKEKRRLVLTFSLAYDTPVDKAVSALLELAEASPLALKDPGPFAAFKTYRDSSMDFVLQVWVKNSDYWTLYYDIQARSKALLEEKGLSIPYPTVTIRPS